jgi:cardiolipin synthase C
VTGYIKWAMRAHPFSLSAPTPLQSRAERAIRLLLAVICAAWLAGCATPLPPNTGRSPSMAFNAPQETALGQLTAAKRSGARSDSGFRLLDNVELAYGTRIAMIEAAQRSLDLQYYAVHADSSTEALLARLRDAAARGVRVRILLDDFNTVGKDAQVLRLAFERNVEIRLFNPIPGTRSSLLGRIVGSLDDIPRIQKRMHNKLFIADNVLGITGGRNLGDAYFGHGEASNFVDLDVLAAGRIVREMSSSFDRYWNDDLAYPVQTLMSREDLDRLKAPPVASPAGTTALPVVTQTMAAPTSTSTVLPGVTVTAPAPETRVDLQRMTLTWAPAVLLVDKPGKIEPGDDEVEGQDTLIDGLLQLMTSAREEIFVISPYFVPGEKMMQVFAGLRARGVRIHVLTNSLASNDAPAAHAGYARYRKALLGMGIEIHEMRATQSAGGSGMGSSLSLGSSGGGGASSKASLHSKVVVIDSRLLVVGSMNLDLRSQIQNSEVALVIRSRSMSAEAIRQIQATFSEGAYRVELNDGQLFWRAPPGAAFKDAASEPDAGLKLRLLVNVIGPFAPDEML